MKITFAKRGHGSYRKKKALSRLMWQGRPIYRKRGKWGRIGSVCWPNKIGFTILK